MKKIQSWLTLGLVAILFIGCAESASDSDAQGETGDSTVVQDEASSAQVPVPVPAPTTSTGPVNPPHGEPGHDCAIPVGAPLDGSGGTAAQPTGTVQPVAQPAAQPASQITLPAGTPNPAHGEPGHDCAVSVGAPLPAK